MSQSTYFTIALTLLLYPNDCSWPAQRPACTSSVRVQIRGRSVAPLFGSAKNGRGRNGFPYRRSAWKHACGSVEGSKVSTDCLWEVERITVEFRYPNFCLFICQINDWIEFMKTNRQNNVSLSISQTQDRHRTLDLNTYGSVKSCIHIFVSVLTIFYSNFNFFVEPFVNC